MTYRRDAFRVECAVKSSNEFLDIFVSFDGAHSPRLVFFLLAAVQLGRCFRFNDPNFNADSYFPAIQFCQRPGYSGFMGLVPQTRMLLV